MKEEKESKMALIDLIKQMQIKGNVDMDFKGEFTTKQIRELQKKDLTCIDLYDYKMVNSSELIERTRLEDSKCENFATDHDLKYYKCPKFNCERIEIQRKAVDEFILKHNYKLYTTEDENCSWWFIK